MNWKHFWNQKALEPEAALQVARVSKGKPLDHEWMQKIALSIKNQIQLKPLDSLLDVCCGNGLLLASLKPFCSEACGVDFSEGLIKNAQLNYSNLGIGFICGEAQNFKLPRKFDKVILYFSFQYFETYELGKKVIANLIKHAAPGAIILIGDIPDRSRWFHYYNSTHKWFSFIKQELGSQNNMGKFWTAKELMKICDELAVKGEKIEQENWQPFSHYRFDFLIRLTS